MTTFKDAANKEHTLNMTVGAAMRIKSKHGIDLLKIEADGNLELFSKMTLDLEKQAVVIAELMGLDKTASDEFVSNLDGRTIADSQRAFFEELISFFQSTGQTAKARVIAQNRLILAKANEIQAQSVDKAAADAISGLTTSGGTSGAAPDA